MNILFITGHPAQVHNFKIVKLLLEEHGNNVCWAATNKDISNYLLTHYNIEYTLLEQPKKGKISKIKVFCINTWRLFRLIRKKRIDFVVSRVNPCAVIAAWILKKKQIALTDTEVAGVYDKVFCKFAGALLTSTSFEKQLRKDQIRYNANIEMFYLHPNYLKSETNEVYSLLNIAKGDPFVVVRFVSWQAFHDKGHAGISLENKIKFIKEISKYAKVFISAEGNSLPDELKEYRIGIPYEKIHVVMKEATLFVGEGASMASECAMMGTPAIYINDLWAGYTNEETKFGLLYSYKTDEKSQIAAMEKTVELLKNPNLKENTKKLKDQFIESHIDPTAFLVWFIENYPQSKQIMKTNPAYQYNFK